jgi:hypothetical protein
MALQESGAGRTAALRVFLALIVAWSILACALVFAIYRLHLSGIIPYLLVIVPAVPLCAMLVLSVRRRALEPDVYVRAYYVGAIVYAALLLVMTVLLALMTSAFVSNLGFAALVSAFPLVCGTAPALVFVLPKRLLNGGILSLRPVAIKLATPALRRLFRMAVLYIVYATLSFASAVLFDGNDAPTGALAYAVALLPVLPLFGLIPIYNKYMAEEQDEFQRHLFHQSILWALLGTLIVSSAMGRLQDHALIFRRHPGFFRPYSVFPVFWWLQIEAVFLVNAVQAIRIQAQEKLER